MVEVTYRDDIIKTTWLSLPWEKLDGCNILVTGATGLVGGCLIEVLMARREGGYQVWATGRDEERSRQCLSRFADDSRFHFLRWEATQPLDCDIPFHYIIHAASNASPNFFATQPVETMMSNILGVRNLMKYGIRHDMHRLLYVSTGEVYGEGDGRNFIEEYSGYVNPLLARNCYPNSKRAAETLCASYIAEYGVSCVIARPCHTYGPHFTPQDNRVYAQFIRNVLRGEDIVMKSAGTQFRSWCYVVDTVAALLYILLKGECGEAYNVADPESNISIRELAEMVASIGGRKVVVELPDAAEQAGYNLVTRSVFSVERLSRLGWGIMKGSMYDKIERTIKDIINNKAQ
jgi:nucleoside-diphosphate-sugar epimerase